MMNSINKLAALIALFTAAPVFSAPKGVTIMKPLSPTYVVQDAPTGRPDAPGLSKETAWLRAARVSEVSYRLQIRLEAEEENFTGRSEIAFTLGDARSPLTIDFSGGDVRSVTVNETPVTDLKYNGKFIKLEPETLRNGNNTVAVAFTHPYSRSGLGLYRLKDPADGRTYVYSQFEPYSANEMFPCFDQPNLKATYTLDVDAPAEWTVISAARESSISKGGAGRRLWFFPVTKKFSTYVFSLHAGPFVEWKTNHKDIPLRLFARRSFADHVTVEEWFKITRQGFAFFESYFDFPYPFGKYDQVLVPDFVFGAMENVGAVAFGEKLIPVGPPTRKDRERIASLILHQMAHMWFGDLVTMDWWDDLWLNESFATYMATLAMTEATEFKDAWQDFFLTTKQWGYWEDQLVTTHPIESNVPGTDAVMSQIDGITYGKGASVLKQIAYFIGNDKFREGVRAYFKNKQFKNARRADFTQALAAAAGKDLDEWTNQWLQTPGVNALRADYQCDKTQLTFFNLIQTADEKNVLRRHRAKIGLFSDDGSVLEHETEYSGPKTSVDALAGRPCPVFVLPNRGDEDYVKIRLDLRTLSTVRRRLSDIRDPLDRSMIWMTLWEMTRDAELSVPEYVDTLLTHLPEENDYQIASAILQTVVGRSMNSASVLKFLAGAETPLAAKRTETVTALETLFWDRMMKSETTDWKKLFFDAYVRAAESPEALKRLSGMLSGEDSSLGFGIDQDRRWGIVFRLSRSGASKADRLIRSEEKKDLSRRGEMRAIAARAAAPNWKSKQTWLKEITNPKTKKTYAELRSAMGSLFPYEQTKLHKKFEQDFFTHLRALSSLQSSQFMESYTGGLVPADCLPEDTVNLEVAIGRYPDLQPSAVKELKIARQENDRCVAARELAVKYSTR